MKFSASDIAGILAGVGESATIAQAGKTSATVTVLYETTALNEMGVLADQPQVTLAESDLAGFDTTLATITVDGTTWKIMKPLPDGSGFIQCGLRRI